MINSIQFLRAFAAIWVALFHIRVFLASQHAPEWMLRLFRMGYGGVHIFFVISGFIIWHTTREGTTCRQFIVKRISRVYSSLWPALALFSIAWFFVEKTMPAFSKVVNSALLFTTLEAKSPTHFLYVTWTLSFELLFYVSFALILCFGKRWAWVGAFVAILIVELLNVAKKNFGIDAGILLTNRCIYEFLLGVGVAVVYGKPSPMWLRRGSLLLGLSLYVCGTWWGGWLDVHPVIATYGLGTVALIYGAPAMERYFAGGVGGFLGETGNWSYAMYLLHPVILVLFRFNGFNWKMAHAYGWELILCMYVLIVLVVSFCYYRWVERPLLKLCRRWLSAA